MQSDFQSSPLPSGLALLPSGRFESRICTLQGGREVQPQPTQASRVASVRHRCCDTLAVKSDSAGNGAMAQPWWSIRSNGNDRTIEKVRLHPCAVGFGSHTPDAFDHPHFILEAKFDGFRALANRCNKLVSRNGHGVQGLRVTQRHR